MIPTIYQSDHYPIVCKWWEGHGFPIIDYRILPKYGLVVPDVCAAWLYQSDSWLSQVGWPVSNPDAKARDVAKGFDMIMGMLKLRAEAVGCPVISAYIGDPSLSQLLLKHGFLMGDKTFDQFVYCKR